jgi:pyruvyltransferase
MSVRGAQRMRESVYRSAIAHRRGADRPLLRDGSLLAHWWPGRNVGDLLSPLLLEAVLHTRVRWVQRTFRGKVLSTGSIVDRVQPGDVVVGSGLIRDRALTLPSDVEVLAVRGPLTAARLALRGEVPFGDPALLLPDVMPATALDRAHVGVVPHYSEVDDVRGRFAAADEVLVIDPRDDPAAFVARLQRCRVVCASSLHGVVLAEAYGIPAVWVEPGPHIVGGAFKFHDHYLGTGRTPPAPLSWADALAAARAGDAAPAELDLADLRTVFASLHQRWQARHGGHPGSTVGA